MTAILNTLKGLALIAVTVLCISLSVTVVNVGKHVSRTLMDADTVITKVNTTLDKVNGKGGMLQQTAETIVRVKDLITLSQATLYKQQKSIDQLDDTLVTLSANVNSAVVNAATDENTVSAAAIQTMDTATTTLVDLQADTVSANTELQSLNRATESANQTVIDTDATINSLKATAVDLQDEVHKLTHPTKKKLGFWGTVYAGVQVAHKFMPPIL